MTSLESSIQEFYSIPQLYRGVSEKDLQLHLKYWGKDAVEITLVNQRYKSQKLYQIKKIVLVLALYGAYSAVTLLSSLQIIDLAFLLLLLYNIQSLFSLIKSEKVLFCLDFALQLETEKFMSRSNLFISATNIHDIVLNEVIENLDVHYVLIVRTKGQLFKQQPIITIFNSLRPSIDCLEIVYKNINKMFRNIEQYKY